MIRLSNNSYDRKIFKMNHKAIEFDISKMYEIFIEIDMLKK